MYYVPAWGQVVATKCACSSGQAGAPHSFQCLTELPLPVMSIKLEREGKEQESSSGILTWINFFKVY